ncbi:MAG: hypothetical protein HQK53_14040 [Oligoflexia bacterium]|nr:hypothetical protein [Oligoflexia bacterium]
MGGIKIKILSSIGLSFFIIFGIGIYLSVKFIQTEFMLRQDEKIEDLAKFFSSSLALAIWNVDQKTIDVNLNALLEIYKAKKVQLLDNEGKVTALFEREEKKIALPTQNVNTNNKQAPVSSPPAIDIENKNLKTERFSMSIYYGNDKLGVLEIFYDHKEALKSAQNFKRLQYISYIIIFILSMTIIYFFVDRAIKNIHTGILKLNTKSQELNQLAQDMDVSGKHLLKFASNLTNYAIETSNALNKISQISSNNTNITIDAQKRYLDVYGLCNNGEKALDTLLSTIKEIQESTIAFEKIKTLVQEIASKTKIINEIAIQTKILSYNASIEAMRVGAHGKGFAVVAQEIRQLAFFVEKSAREIKNIIEISDAITEELIDHTKNKVSMGLKNSLGVTTIFNQINNNIASLKETANKISASSVFQEDLIKKISVSILDFENQNKQNLKIAEGNETVSAHLSEHSNIIRGVVDEINKTVLGEDYSQDNEDDDGNTYMISAIGNLKDFMQKNNLKGIETMGATTSESPESLEPEHPSTNADAPSAVNAQSSTTKTEDPRNDDKDNKSITG